VSGIHPKGKAAWIPVFTGRTIRIGHPRKESAGIHSKEKQSGFPPKASGNDNEEEDKYRFHAFALSRRSATARKRGDKLHGMTIAA